MKGQGVRRGNPSLLKLNSFYDKHFVYIFYSFFSFFYSFNKILIDIIKVCVSITITITIIKNKVAAFEVVE